MKTPDRTPACSRCDGDLEPYGDPGRPATMRRCVSCGLIGTPSSMRTILVKL